jgi:hypothetical protein
MADDRMKNDNAQRNMGAGGQKDQDFGQQSPGRSGQTGGQQAGQQKGQQGGQFGGQQGNMEDDDDFATGGQGQKGGQNRGGQNR